MTFIYKKYFKGNLYPCLLLKPTDESFAVHDANEAFLELMQVDKEGIKDRDFFDTFLRHDENIASVTTSIVKTSLAYVRTFKVPKKIEKIGIVHHIKGEGKQIRYWKICIYPLVDKLGELDFLIYISKNLTEEVNQLK